MTLTSYSRGSLLALCAASVLIVSCSKDEPDTAEGGPGRGGLAAGAAGGGGRSGAGGVGNSVAGSGGRASGAGSGGVRNEAGRPNTFAGSPGAAGAGDPSGEGGDGAVPAPGPDGASPYIRECHGDSLDCADPALRCLGIREGSEVFGYGCSNVCQTVADCSSADSGAAAKVGCVDFVASKHCLLVCKDELTGDRACPTGMSCYVYPGSLLGYCLWTE